MNKNLIKLNENTNSVLEKSKNLLSITNKILEKNNSIIDDSWIERLWNWADSNRIPDPDTLKGRSFDDKNETWNKGIPRDRERLLNLEDLKLQGALFNPQEITFLPNEITNLRNVKILNISNQKLSNLPNHINNLKNLTKLILSDNELTLLPKEIGSLSNLNEIFLGNNPLTSLPDEICNLKKLKFLWLNECNSLLLSKKQQTWIKKLEKDGCNIYVDDDLFERVEGNLLYLQTH